ncbi:thiolase family protein [Rubritalea profundi]|uniref:Acetyl-CoA acyltransferase n=1 Tax=Rubritalea profundi TaxID=1658618 RepID=A0A2S7U072_9BACT|nr:thiolase family protein [Rubritalea profundi]PQJ27794.1 acetyl-CoA acyltransferase [Rubritalea profundi]
MLYIYQCTRTAFTKMGGAMDHLNAADIGKSAVSSLLTNAAIDPALIDEVIMGCVCQPADSANIARVIALRSGIPESVTAATVHRNCASGMEAITTAYERMHADHGQLFVVGGCESMSNTPVLYRKSAVQKFAKLARARSPLAKLTAALQFRPKDFNPLIGLRLGLTDPFTGINMGQTAEILAREYEISRVEQDAFAVNSHNKALNYQQSLNQEISPVYTRGKAIDSDDGIRADSSVEKLANLKPVFEKNTGSVTAGNSSQITDGAAVLLVGSIRMKELGLEPVGRLRGYAYAGCDPSRMGLGPLFAMQKLFKETGFSLAQADIIEINEAFAAQALACIKLSDSEVLAKKAGLDSKLGEIPLDKLNRRGGAIALGHPVGATGARLVLTALDQLRESQQQHALTTLCIGGGQGAALWIERLT